MPTPLFSRLCFHCSLLLLFPFSPLLAQQIGEWIVVDGRIPGTVRTEPSHIASAGAGDYVVAGQMNPWIGPFYLRHTTDGGATWKNIWQDSLGQSSRIVDLLHPTASRFLLLVDSMTDRFAEWQSRRGVVIGSTNGGASWFRVELGKDQVFTSCSMSDSTHGIAIRHTYGTTTGTDDLQRTTDGGMTWTPLPIPAGGTEVLSVAAVGREELRIAVKNPQAKSTDIYRLAGAGSDWEKIGAMPATVRKMIFTTPQNGFAWTEGSRGDLLLRTENSGATWAVTIDTLGLTWDIVDIDFADSEHGIVALNYPTFIRTTDGGKEWTEEYLPASIAAEGSVAKKVAQRHPAEAMAIARHEYVCKFTGRTRLRPPLVHPIRRGDATSFTVQWERVTGATLYDIEVGDTSGDYNVANPEIFNEPWFTRYGLDTTAQAVPRELGRRYEVRLRARNDHDTSDWSAIKVLRVPDTAVELAIPQWLYPANEETGVKVPTTIRWQRVQGATSYLLIIDNLPTFSGPTTITQGDLRDTFYTFGGLRPNTRYYVRLRASNGTVTRWAGLLTFTTGGISSAPIPETPSALACHLSPNLLVPGAEATLTLSVAQADELQIRIVDYAGRELQRLGPQRLDPGQHRLRLDAGQLPAGAAFLLVEGAQGSRAIAPFWVY